MNNVFHFLLVDSTLRSKLNSYCSDKISAWAESWGLDSSSTTWNLSIDQEYNHPLKTSKKIEKAILLENNFIIGVNIKSTSQDTLKNLINYTGHPEKSRLLQHLKDSFTNTLVEALTHDFFIGEPANSYRSDFTTKESQPCYLKISAKCPLLMLDIFLSGYLVDNIVSTYISEKKSVTNTLSPLDSCLSKEKVSFSVEYGKTSLTLNELLSVKVGDVVRLNKGVNDPMTAHSTSGKTLFLCNLGINDGRFSVKVLSK